MYSMEVLQYLSTETLKSAWKRWMNQKQGAMNKTMSEFFYGEKTAQFDVGLMYTAMK